MPVRERVADSCKDLAELTFRSFPFPIEPGLRRFGTPGRDAPVYLTCNFDYTVRLVSRVLADYDCYLLVAPTQGMNVWCASAGGHFGADEVEAAIKLSGIEKLVDHRRLILPRLATPGVNRRDVRHRTGWRVLFGPIEIAELPTWLEGSFPRLIPDRASFPLRRRVEMAVGAGLWPAAMFGVPTALVAGRRQGAAVGVLAYLSSAVFGVAYPLLPVEPGFPQAVPFGALLAAASSALGWRGKAAPRTMVLRATLFAAMGILIGLDFPSWTPTDACKEQLLCFLYPATLAPPGFLPEIDMQTCTGCDICVKVCPKGALSLDENRKAVLSDVDACMSCYACAQQCPVDAIS